MYHFTLSGAGSYAFLAEAFAGRINSPLDPGISLYQLVPGDPTLRFVAGNNNTYDPVQTTNGQQVPLYSDSFLTASLTAGDYYLAVAGGSNTPSTLENLPPGTPGLFDPNVSHSGQLGFSTGPYVLNILAARPTGAPQVVTTGPGPGASLDQPPSLLTVQFDRPVDLAQLAFETFQKTSQDTVSGVYVQGTDGTKYFPRFQSYDPASGQATFLMLDRLPAGSYQLYLSGAQGITDFAGDPLVGNSPGGDYVDTFTVLPGGLVPAGDASAGYTIAAQADAASVQDLGTLFPHELQAGVTLTRDYSQDPAQAPGDTAESFQFQVLQDESYTFNLSGTGLPDGVALTLTAQGQSPSLVPLNNGQSLFGELSPGTYTITVGNWSPDQSAGVSYQLQITFISTNDNAPPLVSGPIPALQMMLIGLPSTTADNSSTALSPSAPTALAGAPDGAGGSLGSGVTSVSASPPVFAPTSSLAGPVSEGAPAGTPVVAHLSEPADSASATVSPVGLIALGVAPVGSLSGSTGTAAPTQVAFALPSLTSSSPLVATTLVRLVTSIQMFGEDSLTDPQSAIPGLSGDEAAGPAVIFEQALQPVPQAAPPQSAPRAADAATLAATEPAAVDPPATAAEPGLPRAAEEGPAEESSRVLGLADLAWGAALGSLGAVVMVVVKRRRSAGGAGQPGPWFWRRAAGRNVPARLKGVKKRKPAVAAPRGLSS
jgi:hypothetical protein